MVCFVLFSVSSAPKAHVASGSALIAASWQVKTRGMENGTNPGLADQIAGALDWWRDAGVDCDFHDEPANWLANAKPAEARAPSPAPETPAPEPAAPARRAPRAPLPVPEIALDGMPSDLPAFIDWWLAEPALDNGRVGGRVAPRGTPGAALMVLVPEPEREDRETLLSGPEGRLLSGFLSAAGMGEEQAYVASALPRHTPMADWAACAAQGMGSVVRRHVALARPRRLLVLGGNILPLVANDPAQDPADLRIFNHEGTSMPVFAARSLRAMLERPRWKAKLWRDWLQWTA
jgi:DNA polymerase